MYCMVLKLELFFLIPSSKEECLVEASHSMEEINSIHMYYILVFFVIQLLVYTDAPTTCVYK